MLLTLNLNITKRFLQRATNIVVHFCLCLLYHRAVAAKIPLPLPIKLVPLQTVDPLTSSLVAWPTLLRTHNGTGVTGYMHCLARKTLEEQPPGPQIARVEQTTTVAPPKKMVVQAIADTNPVVCLLSIIASPRSFTRFWSPLRLTALHE